MKVIEQVKQAHEAMNSALNHTDSLIKSLRNDLEKSAAATFTKIENIQAEFIRETYFSDAEEAEIIPIVLSMDPEELDFIMAPMYISFRSGRPGNSVSHEEPMMGRF